MSRIDRVNTSNPSLDRSPSSEGEDQVRTGQPRQNSSAKDDFMSLHSRAGEIDRIATFIAHSRAQRVEQLRELFTTGTYNVPGREIAQKLIDANRR